MSPYCGKPFHSASVPTVDIRPGPDGTTGPGRMSTVRLVAPLSTLSQVGGMGRIRDAVRTLIWGAPITEVARMRAEWAALVMEVTNVLEQLNAWAARHAKREARQAKKRLAPEAPPEPSQLPLIPYQGDRKAQLRAKLSQMRSGNGPASAVTDENEERVVS